MPHGKRHQTLLNFSQLATEKGFDYLIENHALELCEMELTEKEWEKLTSVSKKSCHLISDFVAKKKFQLHHFFHKENLKKNLCHFFHPKHFHRHPDILEKDGRGMRYLKNELFQNWDKLITKHPKYIFFPKSKIGLQNLVRWTEEKEHRFSIRTVGYTHSSTDVFGEDNEVLVSLLDHRVMTKLPAKYPALDAKNELQGIELVGDEFIEDGQLKHLCKIGAATCNYHFQNWVHDPKRGNYQWAIPFNVVLTEITFGGGILMMCHGGGRKSRTLSDLVVEIEYIDINGNIKTIADPEKLKAACSFGILGIVTSFTVKLDKMSYANLKTAVVKPTVLTVPPPGFKL